MLSFDELQKLNTHSVNSNYICYHITYFLAKALCQGPCLINQLMGMAINKWPYVIFKMMFVCVGQR